MAQSKLTPERADKILALIRAGNDKKVAAQASGIDESTFYNWIRAGEAAKSGDLFQFFQSVKIAEAEAEARMVAIIAKAAVDTWTAAAWYLERKHPMRWARVEKQQVIDPHDTLDPDAELDRRMDELAARRRKTMEGTTQSERETGT